MGKCGVLHFYGNNLSSDASYTIDQYRTLIGNYIRRIEWHHLRAPTTTGTARNRVRNQSNSALISGSHVAHCLSISRASRSILSAVRAEARENTKHRDLDMQLYMVIIIVGHF